MNAEKIAIRFQNNNVDQSDYHHGGDHIGLVRSESRRRRETALFRELHDVLPPIFTHPRVILSRLRAKKKTKQEGRRLSKRVAAGAHASDMTESEQLPPPVTPSDSPDSPVGLLYTSHLAPGAHLYTPDLLSESRREYQQAQIRPTMVRRAVMSAGAALIEHFGALVGRFGWFGAIPAALVLLLLSPVTWVLLPLATITFSVVYSLSASIAVNLPNPHEVKTMWSWMLDQIKVLMHSFLDGTSRFVALCILGLALRSHRGHKHDD